jgi:hypothetical protein
MGKLDAGKVLSRSRPSAIFAHDFCFIDLRAASTRFCNLVEFCVKYVAE